MLINFESNLKDCYDICNNIENNVYDLWTSLIKNEIDILKSEDLAEKILKHY